MYKKRNKKNNKTLPLRTITKDLYERFKDRKKK